MVGAIFLAVIVALMVIVTDRVFMGECIFHKVDEEGNEQFDLSWVKDQLDGLWQDVLVISLGTGLARFLTKVSGSYGLLAVVALVIMVAMMLRVAWWWKIAEGKGFGPFICLITLECIFLWVALLAASKISRLTDSSFLEWLVIAVPMVAFTGATISAMAGWAKRAGNKGLATFFRVAAVVLVICIALNGVFSINIERILGDATGIAAKTGWARWWPFGDDEPATVVSDADNVTVTPQPTATSTVWYAFYNPSMQRDNDPENDLNFGFNCYDPTWVASQYDAEMRRRIEIDPALGAANMAWLDANVGTRYIGRFYDECAGEWSTAINDAKVVFIRDGKAVYDETLEGFFKFLDTAVSVELRYLGSGIQDQMYMNPYTKSGVPDVIVLKSDDHEGYFLVYTFNIKGMAVEVSYRVDCGFQPCNVESVMGIKPQSMSPAGGNGGGNTPSNPKDPTKGTNVGANDTAGPGPDTNNGVGAQTSKVDDDTHTGSYDSYQQYQEDMAEIQWANDPDRTDSVPTYSPPPNTTVDDRSNIGSGYGGIDVPTVIVVSTTYQSPSGGGNTHEDKPAGEWGGPPD